MAGCSAPDKRNNCSEQEWPSVSFYFDFTLVDPAVWSVCSLVSWSWPLFWQLTKDQLSVRSGRRHEGQRFTTAVVPATAFLALLLSSTVVCRVCRNDSCCGYWDIWLWGRWSRLFLAWRSDVWLCAALLPTVLRHHEIQRHHHRLHRHYHLIYYEHIVYASAVAYSICNHKT